MNIEKPIIIFTNFWDAACIVENLGFVLDEQVVRFSKPEVEIISVALAKPRDVSGINKTLDFFCPNWPMLKDYKANRDWKAYTDAYKRILIENKDEIVVWIDSLKPKVYILCCWENTCNGANCHRRIMYDALKTSKRTKDSANYIYRHGDKNQYDAEKQVVSLIDFLKSSENETDTEKVIQYCKSIPGGAIGDLYVGSENNQNLYKVKVCEQTTRAISYLVFEVDCDRKDFGEMQQIFESEQHYRLCLPGSPFNSMEVKRLSTNQRSFVELALDTRTNRSYIRFFSSYLRFLKSEEKLDHGMETLSQFEFI